MRYFFKMALGGGLPLLRSRTSRCLDEDSKGVAELLITVYGKKKDILFEKTAYEPEQTMQEMLETWKRNGIDVGEVATSSGVAVHNNGTEAKPPLSGPTSNNTIPSVSEKSSAEDKKTPKTSSTISKITSEKAGSPERIMAFLDLPNGEHTINGKTFTKIDNTFTFEGKTLNAREIEKATRTTSEKIKKTSDLSESSDTSNVSDRQTFSDKFRAKEKETTGTLSNPGVSPPASLRAAHGFAMTSPHILK